ncbi:MAG: CapA family protein [Candidatus Syntrophosphaera sp.]|nr:CapA family protein [Candidatus Syntrophosphaera sp.]
MSKRKKLLRSRILGSAWPLLIALACGQALATNLPERYDIIEDFESGSVTLLSWLDEDVNPSAWQLTTVDTHENSAYSLVLTGNTWKQQMITPVSVDSSAVFQVAAKTTSGARYQGIGFCDGTNVLFYSFSGSVVMDIEEWVPVYQGAFSHGVWNTYQIPIADDWYSFFDYLPVISSLVYVNDLDGVSNRSFWIDTILDISSDIGTPPTVTVSHQITFQTGIHQGSRDVGVQFSSVVTDPDSGTFTYRWDFGDGQMSTEANPYHVYTVLDDHPYRATLKVTDDTGKWGLASCLVNVDPGNSSLPLKMNFVGDIMLARRYEQAGGIIPTLGVNAIFAPTLDILGNAADITVANLEVVLSNVGTPHPTKSVVYRGNPANVNGLVYAGIDKVSTANNHTLDYGQAAMAQMMGILDQNGIIHSGSGANSYAAYTPAFINRSGLNIAFLAGSDRTGQYNNAQPYLQAGYNKPGFAYMTPYYIQQQLAAVEGIADLKIVELHGGSEYSLSPGSGYDKGENPFLGDDQDEDYSPRTDVPHMWDIAIRHWAVDSGADLVIVHHPHIIQGFEVYQGKVIAHSLGNYVFDLDYPETMPTLIFYADADQSGFSNFLIRPAYIDGYIPVPATGQLGKYILDYLAMRSTELGTKLLVDYNDVTASILMDDDAVSVSNHTYSWNKDLSPEAGGGNQTAPFKLPRFGSIGQVVSIEPASNSEYRLGAETIWYGNFEDEGSTLWDVRIFDTLTPFDGQRSAMLSPASGQTETATIKKRCKWYDNTKKYILHGWIKTNSATNANIIIRYYNSRTSYLLGTETITANISGTTDWTWFYKELTIPGNAWYYDIRLTCSNTSGGTVEAMFDNVGLIEWTPWTEIPAQNLIPFPNNYYWMQARTSESPKSLTICFTEQRLNPSSRRKSAVPPAQLAINVFPNPFQAFASISFVLPEKGKTTLSVYNIRGQKVRTLAEGFLPEGKHRFTWDAKDGHGRRIASGIYFLRLEQGGQTAVRKMVLMN